MKGPQLTVALSILGFAFLGDGLLEIDPSSHLLLLHRRLLTIVRLLQAHL